MSKKILAPLAPLRNLFLTGLENLNRKSPELRERKFLTGFIFLIIFLIVFGFLIFNFAKIEEVKAIDWSEPDACSLTDPTWNCCSAEVLCAFPYSCSDTSPSCGADHCNKTCGTRAWATFDSTKCIITNEIPSCACNTRCQQESGICTITDATCEYTCLANHKNCNGDGKFDGCECGPSPANCCGVGAESNFIYGNCPICSGTSSCATCPADCTKQATCDNVSHTKICSAAIGSCADCPPVTASCDLDSANGCETDLNTPDNCGSCGRSCGANTSCSALGSCVCNAPYTDCNGDLGQPVTDGCETITNSDHKNCGGCNNVCALGKACINNVCRTPNLHGFAWSKNIGWISLNSMNCDIDRDGVMDRTANSSPGRCSTSYSKRCNVDDDCPIVDETCIKGDDAVPLGICPDDLTPIPPYGVYLPPFDTLFPFEGSYYTSSEDYSDDFHGYAWSENIGWIKFDPLILTPPPCGTTASGCSSYPANLVGSEVWGWIRACAGAANSDCSGGANPDAGGWNGWISLRSGNIQAPPVPFAVSLDNNPISPTFNQFSGWAWGGGGDGYCSVTTGQSCTKNEDCPVVGEICTTPSLNSIIGWISFNCSNQGVCTIPTGEGGPSNYKVIYRPENEVPTVSILADSINYCNIQGVGIPEGAGRVSLSWTYTDPENTNQSQFEIKVQTTGGGTTYVDCSGVDHADAISQSRASGGTGTSSILIVPTPTVVSCDMPTFVGDIPYGGTYQWSVRVSDSDGLWSDWSAPTPINLGNPIDSHAHPWPDFSWTPLYPAVFQNVTFNADPPILTEFYDAVCSATPDDLTNCHYQWTFENANPPEDLTNKIKPITQFITAGLKEVTLKVTDSDTFSCTRSRPVKVGLPLPEWKEIAPVNP